MKDFQVFNFVALTLSIRRYGIPHHITIIKTGEIEENLMAKTYKTICVKSASINEAMVMSKKHLCSKGFRIKEQHNVQVYTRGTGFLTAQQRFVLKFSEQDSQGVRIDGEFFTIAFYFMKNTVAEKAIAGGIPRRKGYKLMMEYISGINCNYA